MKPCTGPRYPGESAHMAAIPNWHGKYGHLNVITLDHDSMETAYGQHDRVVVFQPRGNECYARIDHVWSLGMPGESQIIAVMKAWPNEIKGKWRIDRLDQGETSTDIFMVRK